ncbi:MAG: bifunctional anthranilate synthase component I family protein/class IV aminotransferase [Patulibacter minatonensis]
MAVAPAAAPSRPAVALGRTPLGLEPSVGDVVAAIAAGDRPFVLAGRWGLPEASAPGDRVVIAGVGPSRTPPPEAAFTALDDLPALHVDPGAPPAEGAVGGGMFGWLGFDLSRTVERTLGSQPRRPAPLPASRLAWYDDVLRRDPAGTWWVEALVPAGECHGDDELAVAAGRWRARLAADAPRPAGVLGPMRVAGGGMAGHRAAVAEAIERVRAGEIFQANVCLRLEGELRGSVASLVDAVLQRTDPWFGGWFDAGDGRAILSASPELFLRRRGRSVVTGPIKGTLPRADAVGEAVDPRDDATAAALLASAKDRAEHVMIVDLMRNDLGRVCEYGSIRPDREPTLEPHAGVWHLVSAVRGTLHEHFGDGRLVRATFPPGSVTGAPKVQAMRVISAVESVGRDVYTGAHGFASPVAGLELAVTIRTLEVHGEQAWIGVGGGIVADSEPQAELDEALGKASALLAAAGSALAPAEGPEARGAGAVTGLPWLGSSVRRPDPAAGVIETLAIRRGVPQRLDRHLARLQGSATALGLAFDESDLRRRLQVVLAETAPREARLRIELVAGAAPFVEVVPFSTTDPAGVLLAPVVVPGGLGPHKWRDRSLLAAVAADLPAGATALLLDADGAVLEAAWANLWWEDGGALCTPNAGPRILAGITRDALLAVAPDARLVEPPPIAALAARPLMLSSARGLTPARLADTPSGAVRRAADLADALSALLPAR